ncbi:hypothetical protein [Spirosoma areae]
MKTTKLRSLAVVVVLWLALGAGCSKEPPLPDCKNGSCCSPGTQAMFFKRINGALADYGGLSFGFKDPVNVVNGIVVDGIPICDVQWDMIDAMRLKSNVTIANGKIRLIDSTNRYRYRVWGIVYEHPEIINWLPVPDYRIRVEKVEEAP